MDNTASIFVQNTDDLERCEQILPEDSEDPISV